MGAELCVESEYGKGSTFALTGAFPAFAVVSEKDSERAERMTALKARCAGLRALVVDDDITAQDLATVLLHRLGCEVDRAHDGLVCLEQAAARHYDLVIMDWHLPNLDGLATLAELRRLEDYHDVPVLAVTAKAQESDREACLEAGMCGYIAKPLDVDAFYSELQNCLMAERCAG